MFSFQLCFQVGFCHASELSDNNIDNIQMNYSVGESVEAKVLKVSMPKVMFSIC